MRLSRLAVLAVFATFAMLLPGAQAAESVGDQADMAEIDAMDLEKAGNYDGAIAKHRDALKLIESIPKYAKKTTIMGLQPTQSATGLQPWTAALGISISPF